MKLSYLYVFLLILFPVFIFFFSRGVVVHDEGYILYSSEKIYQGLLPYRDFHFAYTPGSLYLTSFFFAILKPSILSSRILMLLIALVTSWLIFKTIMLPTKNKLYATIAVLIFAAWGPSHINFSWPVMFAIPSALATCLLLLKFLETRNTRYIFFAGSAVFLVFLFKQNFGVAMLFPILVFFSTKNARSYKYILPFIYGCTWSFILFLIYLLQTESFAPFVNDFYDFTLKRILIDNALTTQFIYPDNPLKMLGRTTLYLSPLILSILSIALLLKRRRFHLVFIPVAIASFYIFGIRPTTDYTHLAPLLALVGIPIALLLRYNISSTIRILVLFFSIVLIFIGFHTALFKGYYRWDSPLIDHNRYVNYSKVGVFVDRKAQLEFKEVIRTANQYTQPNDYILVDSYASMFYFISSRREPLQDNYLSIEINPNEYYRKVLGALVGKKIKLVITPRNGLLGIPIEKYVLANYAHLESVGDFDIYIRNP